MIQYALTIAAEADDQYRRGLGAIHLIKYVYLGDLAFASKNDGETFTGTNWSFHNFGPWSKDVNDRVKPAAEGIDANRNVYTGKKTGNEAVRYEAAPDSTRLGQLEQLIPANVAAALRKAVKKYGDDTNTLLRDVYLTIPMRNAAPGEELDFSTVVKAKGNAAITPRLLEGTREAPPKKFFTVSQRKKIAAEAARRVNESMARRAARLSVHVEPMYDEVFYEGVRWLDDLAGKPMPEKEAGELEISDSAWKDRARTDPEEA